MHIDKFEFFCMKKISNDFECNLCNKYIYELSNICNGIVFTIYMSVREMVALSISDTTTATHYQNGGVLLLFLVSNKILLLVKTLENPHYEVFTRESLY